MQEYTHNVLIRTLLHSSIHSWSIWIYCRCYQILVTSVANTMPSNWTKWKFHFPIKQRNSTISLLLVFFNFVFFLCHYMAHKFTLHGLCRMSIIVNGGWTKSVQSILIGWSNGKLDKLLIYVVMFICCWNCFRQGILWIDGQWSWYKPLLDSYPLPFNLIMRKVTSFARMACIHIQTNEVISIFNKSLKQQTNEKHLTTNTFQISFNIIEDGCDV